MLNGHLLPVFGGTRIDAITVTAVNEWFASYGRRTPATRADAYRLLTSVMKTAIRGAAGIEPVPGARRRR